MKRQQRLQTIKRVLAIQFKKIGKMVRAQGKVFLFKNSQVPYKLIFLENLQIPSFYFKGQSPTRTFEIKKGPKKFDLDNFREIVNILEALRQVKKQYF